ncbi:hypothetical protein RSAG8_12123, partial [Rhizoctonia solani AG-8 WAC10335]
MIIFQTGYMIETDKGDRPQLVHHQYSIHRPSRLVRFATCLGLTNGTYNSPETKSAYPTRRREQTAY